MKYCAFFVIFHICIKGFMTNDICLFGCEGKCLADPVNLTISGVPRSDAELFSSRNSSNFVVCSNLCQIDFRCFMSAFFAENRTCQMYRRLSFDPTPETSTRLFIWNCCNTNMSYDPKNRCPGFWRSILGSRSDNRIRPSDPLIEMTGFNHDECPMECLKNPICGAVNILKQDVYLLNTTVINCQLIIQFPVEGLHYVDDDRWDTLQWQCAYNYTVPTPNTTCIPRVGHSDGKWVVENTSVVLGSGVKFVLFFHTFDNRQCWFNCAFYRNCKRAWYSLKSFYCVLEAEKDEPCAVKSLSNSYKFTTYIWKICNPHNPVEAAVVPKDYECRTLVDNKYTYIYPINCGRPPTNISSLYPCWKNPHYVRGTVYTHNLHCQANQSFRAYDKLDNPPSYMPHATWQRAFTGYASFWLVNVTETNFVHVAKSVCDVFDANMDVPNVPTLRIIMKSQWFPSKPYGPEPPFPNYPAKYVIIDTQGPQCNCFSVEACSASLRLIDRIKRPTFYSIPYNFVVTGDGTAYEARGWDLEAQAATAKWNPYSIAIGICGRYLESPGVPALTAVKQLIKMAVDLNKVEKNYIIYIYNDIRDGETPLEGLRRVIELWPHYRGYLRDKCRPIEYVTIAMNIVSILAFSLIILLFCNYLLYTTWHNKICHSVRKCRMEEIYSNFCDSSIEILPLINMYNIHYLLMDDKNVSSFITPIFWIEDRLPICERGHEKDPCYCRSSIFSFFDLCRLQSKIVNVGSLVLLPDVRFCPKTLAFIFQRNEELGIASLLILHVSHVRSLYRCIHQLHRENCVCSYFHLTQYSTQLFINELSPLETTKDSREKDISRSNLEGRFTFVVEANYSLRYLCDL